MNRLVLLGDSILDNAPYVRPEPDTADLLQRALGSAWNVELLARDGSTMDDLRFQLSHLATETPVAVLSIGGNDAIEHIGLLEPRQATTTVVLQQLVQIAEDFGTSYAAVVREVQRRVQRLIVCTIYEPPLTEPRLARLARAPLAVLNDQILRVAAAALLDVIELRAVCTDARDFVQEIEPSPAGARKIAAVIAKAVQAGPGDGTSRIFAA